MLRKKTPEKTLSEDFGHLKVNKAILNEDAVTYAIYDAYAEGVGRIDYTVEAWLRVIQLLDKEKRTIKKWLEDTGYPDQSVDESRFQSAPQAQ